MPEGRTVVINMQMLLNAKWGCANREQLRTWEGAATVSYEVDLLTSNSRKGTSYNHAEVLSHDNWCPDRNLNRISAELSIRLTSLVGILKSMYRAKFLSTN
jgi:hypothetical protein